MCNKKHIMRKHDMYNSRSLRRERDTCGTYVIHVCDTRVRVVRT